MSGPNGWTPQFNGCPIKQPCDSDCSPCNYFKTGDKVISIGGLEIGKRGVLTRKTTYGRWRSFRVKWDNGGSNDKFVQHYKLQYDDNDIEFYQKGS